MLRAHQKEGYDALFNSGKGTICKLLANPRYLGTSKVGFFGVLQTWGRDPMVYHPHVHFVVPGGGVSEDGTKWLATPRDFLFPHARAIRLYKKLFADESDEDHLGGPRRLSGAGGTQPALSRQRIDFR